jgi:hypothetical protein
MATKTIKPKFALYPHELPTNVAQYQFHWADEGPYNSSYQDRPLDSKLKAKWLAALRSGNYTQAQSRLRVKLNGIYGYCCLGVACNLISHRKGWRFDCHDSEHRPAFAWRDTVSNSTKLPFISETIADHLATLNDEAKWTFAMIADWIEVNL